MDSTLVKDKYNTCSSEATEQTKKGGKVHNNQNQRINFKESLQYHNIGLILIMTGLKIT